MIQFIELHLKTSSSPQTGDEAQEAWPKHFRKAIE